MDYRSLIGQESPEAVFEVEKGHIRRFAEAIGDDNPLYRDEAFARAQGYAGLVAPPTFPTAFRASPPPRWYADLDKRKILHGRQVFRYRRPLVAGDVITTSGKVVDVYTKEGSAGLLSFIVHERHGRDATGALVFTDQQTLIMRS